MNYKIKQINYLCKMGRICIQSKYISERSSTALTGLFDSISSTGRTMLNCLGQILASNLTF